MLEYIIIATLGFLFFWTLIEAAFALFLIVVCELFGRNRVPATVPNKSVWG